ncbi:MAG: TatD family hydrolase [Rikenellaceae bacterium]
MRLILTSYIGEVGLDFSREGVSTKELQIRSFEFVLNAIKARKKIISLHSRKAEAEVLDMLTTADVHNAIFHWYTGSLKTLDKIINQGHYISINSAMTQSANGKSIINNIPLTNMLTETDSPYISGSSISKVIEVISEQRGIDKNRVASQIAENFQNLLNTIR